MNIQRYITAFAFACLAVLPIHANAIETGKAEGVLTVNGEAVNLQFAYAITKPGTFDENTEDTLIFLTNMPLETGMLTEGGLLQQLERTGELKSVELTLNADQEPISIRVRHQAFGSGPSGRGSEEFALVAASPDRIEGKLFTTKVEDFFDTTYEYNVSFNADIFRKTPAGPATAEDMKTASDSPQATIYRALTDAVMAGDVEAMKPLVIADLLTELDSPNAPEVVGFLQTIMPKQVEFLRLTINGDSATLEMQSKDEGALQAGTVDFTLDGNDWKIGLSQWEG